jgi:hypothetical protein
MHNENILNIIIITINIIIIIKNFHVLFLFNFSKNGLGI